MRDDWEFVAEGLLEDILNMHIKCNKDNESLINLRDFYRISNCCGFPSEFNYQTMYKVYRSFNKYSEIMFHYEWKNNQIVGISFEVLTFLH